MSQVGPGGFSQMGGGTRGWGWITAAALVVLLALVAVWGVFAVVQSSTDIQIPGLERFFPRGIDRERTVPVGQAPAQPGEQLPSGGARGDLGSGSGSAGGTVGSTGGMSGGPSSPSTGGAGVGGR
jgi:hypothetical protein